MRVDLIASPRLGSEADSLPCLALSCLALPCGFLVLPCTDSLPCLFRGGCSSRKSDQCGVLRIHTLKCTIFWRTPPQMRRDPSVSRVVPRLS